LYTPSTYSDKILSCVDCNQEFVFAATDQQFYAEKEFSEPRRCASCRAARKAARGDSGGSGYGGGVAASRKPVRMCFASGCSTTWRDMAQG